MRPGSSLWFSAEMWCVRLSQFFVTVCHQGLRSSSRAVQCPPSAIIHRREVVRWWWWRETAAQTRQTQTQTSHQHLMIEPASPLPCCFHSAACGSDKNHYAWRGYEACDNCCEDRIEQRHDWRFNESSMFARFQRRSGRSWQAR